MLKRKIQKVIQDYYRLGSNKVLLLDGARQIGKSYIIRYEGKKFFKNFHLLQQEMGHASANLLRTRYLSMSGITAESASRFWDAAIVIRDN